MALSRLQHRATVLLSNHGRKLALLVIFLVLVFRNLVYNNVVVRNFRLISSPHSSLPALSYYFHLFNAASSNSSFASPSPVNDEKRQRFNATPMAELVQIDILKQIQQISNHSAANTFTPQLHDGTQQQHQQQQQQQERLNAVQILNLLAAKNFNISQAPSVFPKPPVENYDISSIYSKNAWLKLRTMFHRSDEQVVICVNGGSASAGSGNILYHDRFHSLFANSFRNATHVDRARGGRDTMHSVHVMHSILPMHTDIILWEYAINDVEYHLAGNETLQSIEARNQLILWLEQLVRITQQRNQTRPPLVILVYLWSSNQYGGKKFCPDNLVFEAHRGVAEHYDFVVGHVNLAKYLESSWTKAVIRSNFMADIHHPNSLSHRLVYFLLHDLVIEDQRTERPRQVNSTPPVYSWTCGDGTPEKRLLRKLLQNRHVIASFSKEKPRNENLLPGMLLGDDVIVQDLGKSNPLRRDRKYTARLPCCGRKPMLQFNDVSKNGLLEGAQLALYPNSSGLILYFDHDNVTEQVFECRNSTEWPCIFSDPAGMFFYWIVLDAPRNVSNITMCNSLPNCEQGIKAPSIQTMAIYGDDSMIVR